MDYSEDIERCIQVLQDGGLILYPTDTVWGIGCDATNADAVKKIYELKSRSEVKSMIVLVAEEDEILKHIANPDARIFDYLKKVEKPTTVIYDGAIGLAENLVGQDSSIAVRIVSDPFCRHLIKRFRKPIVSTSANLSGEPTPSFFDEIVHFIKQGVDYVVQYRQGDNTPQEASTIIRWQNNTPVVIRP